MRRILLWSTALLFLVLVWTIKQAPDGKVHLVFCDVGQGDAALVIKGDFQMLIDTGPKNGGVLDCLSRHLPFWDGKIEVFVNSHPQADHIGDLLAVEQRYRIGQKILTGTAGEVIRYGDLRFDVLWPKEEKRVLGAATDLNELSVVMRFSFHDFSALFTGDLGEAEEAVLAAEGIVPAAVLKVAHHGSKYSSSMYFLAAIKPKLAVISVGKNNYGHPTAEALARLTEVGARIWRTDKDGEAEVVTDGEKYVVE